MRKFLDVVQFVGSAFISALGAVIVGFGVVAGIILLAYTLVFAFALVWAPMLMWAWNGSLVPLLGMKVITLGQSFWLLILAGMLIKSTNTNNVQKEK